MHLIRGLSQLTSEHRPCVATIGNFDGVHTGHETVVNTLIHAAQESNLPATVITFSPLAREFFAPHAALRLQPLQQRVDRLFELGVDQILVIEFDKDFAAYSPTEFVNQVLIEGLGIKYLSVGDDFRFGHERAGDFNLLTEIGRSNGFEVVAHPTFMLDHERVSSGRIREAIKVGNFDLAAQLLGRPYEIRGNISQGQQLGRTIGFPTANIVLDAHSFAVQGVYAVQVTLPDDREIAGVANVGWRPTVEGQENRLEVHLFDFSESLYGDDVSVRFVAPIREEQKFDSFEALKQQIQLDSVAARQILGV